MPLNKIPEVEEEYRANQSRFMTNSGHPSNPSNTVGFTSGIKSNQFESTIKKGDIFKNQYEEEVSVSSDDLGDEGDITDLRANKNLESIGNAQYVVVQVQHYQTRIHLWEKKG